jgi:hypothetical protein
VGALEQTQKHKTTIACLAALWVQAAIFVAIVVALLMGPSVRRTELLDRFAEFGLLAIFDQYVTYPRHGTKMPVATLLNITSIDNWVVADVLTSSTLFWLGKRDRLSLIALADSSWFSGQESFSKLFHFLAVTLKRHHVGIPVVEKPNASGESNARPIRRFIRND